MRKEPSELGPLERLVMHAIWRQGIVTIRELIEREDLKLAVTTVQTTMDRLCNKGFLDRYREPHHRRYHYRAPYTQVELEIKLAVTKLREALAASGDTLPLSYLVDLVAERNGQMLDELVRIVEAKRKTLGGANS